MGLAILDIKIAQRNPALALRAGNVDFGAIHEQCGREIAAEGGVAALSLRGDVTSIPAIL